MSGPYLPLLTPGQQIARLTTGVNVMPMLWALQANPWLWDTNDARTRDPSSPHHHLSDIWVRYAAPGVDASQPHEAVWYEAAEYLPIREIVYPLMAAVQGVQLGGVLITRIPAGRNCEPHIDHGWHARHYEKFAVQIQSAPGQMFCFDDARLETQPGDIFTFDNSFSHWVENPTAHDRITAIVCIRTERQAQHQLLPQPTAH